MPIYSSKPKLLALGVLAIWLTGVCWGVKPLNDYSFSPGIKGENSLAWPSDTGLARSPEGCTLVIALHPECPCSRATVSELERLLSSVPGSFKVFAIFAPGSTNGGKTAELPAKVSQLRGVTVIQDLRTEELRRFSVLTSGETRLYDPKGQLLFHGGITASRGHVGENPGATAVLAFAHHQRPTQIPTMTPVFGCALFASAPAPSS